MNVRKRGLALLMCICMIFTLLPFSALADATAKDGDIVYGTYGTDGNWQEDKNLNDTATYSLTGENALTLTKTATKTADNTYRIDLKVVMTQTTSTTPPGSAATVLVIDTSGSMDICATCNKSDQEWIDDHYGYTHKDKCETGHSGEVQYADTRLAAAKEAAISFLNKYKGDTANTHRYVSVVTFNTYASVAQGWLDVSVQKNYDTVKSAINNLSAGGGTNLDQALYTAKAQFSSDTVKNIPASAKNVIALTDGCPTYYGNGIKQHSSYGCPDTNKATAKTATELKTVAGVYTVCFGAANEKCWIKGSAHAWGLFGIETDWHLTDGPKVGDFLKGSIATSASHAYNADNTTELISAFEAITNTIVNGLKSGTVTDPMGDNVSVVGDVPSGFVTNDNGKTYTWELSGAQGITADGKTTYTYETSYTVKLDTSGDDAYHPLNGRTTFTAAGKTYDFNVPGVYREAPKYTVTYQYDGDVPDGAQAQLPTQETYREGDTVTVKPAPTLDGYTFSGWTATGVDVKDGKFTMPGNVVVFKGTWVARNDLSYTVHHYWNGTTESVYNDEIVTGQTFNTTVPVSPKAANDNYTPVPTDINSVTITIGVNEVTFYYYKNVTLTANSKTVIYNGEEQTVSGFTGAPDDADFSAIKVGAQGTNAGTYPANFAVGTANTVDKTGKYIVVETTNGSLEIARANVTVTAKSYEIAVGSELPKPEADVSGLFGTDTVEYTISGMPENSDASGTHTLTPSGDSVQGNYNVNYKPGTLTIYDTYTVTYKYEYTDGTPVPETVTAPVDSNSPYREGAIVNVAAAPVGTAIPGYTFTGWFAEDGTQITAKTFEMPNKNVVITGKWEPADTTYTIECYWGYDNQNKLPADTDGQVFSGKVGQKINLIDTPTITGYTACMSDVIKLKASGNVLKVYYLKNVTITPGNATVTYDGEEHFVNTFSATTIDGDATETMAQYIYAYVAGTNAGVYPVGVFHKASEGNPLAATDEVPAAIALNVNDQIGGRYCVTEIGEGNLTINRAKVTVTADDKSKYVGEKDPKFTTTIEGLVKGESESLIDYTIKRDPGEKAGTYKIIPVGDKEQGNYEVTFKNGNLTIKSRPVNPGIYTEIIVEITGNSDSVVYDGTEHSVKDYTVKISDPRYTEKDFTFTGKAEASGVNAGTYEMGLKAEQFRNTNALFRNVKFVIKADGVLTITPKDLTITAGSKTEYGPTPVTCDEWTVSGLAAGDKVESVKITGIQSVPGSSPNVPSDAVIKNAKGEDVTKDYAIKYVNGTLTMLEVLNKEDHFNYIIGTPEGLSLPTANVTRAEVATIFFRLMTDDARAKFDSLDNNFSDVAKGQWYNRAISTLANAGIIKGDPAGTYRPGDPITRAEMATIIARFGDFKEGGKTFNDISGHWAQKYIELAASNGWINGNPDGTFKPNNNITRAETVAMINRVLDRQTKDVSDLLPVSQMTNWSDNANTAAWYYRDMQEATNNHKAERVGNSEYEKWTEKLPDIDWASYQI